MATKKENGYACSYCGKEYTHSQLADQCRDSHNLIYLAISKEDLNRLIGFIYLKNDELLSESLMKSILKYRRNV